MANPSLSHAPQSYLMRGHHFGNLLKAYSPHFGAAGAARDLVYTMDEYRRKATREDIDLALLDLPELPSGDRLVEWEKAYAIDMIGDTPAQADRVQHLIEADTRRFQQLSEDHPVTVGVGILDGRCNAIFFQRHCQNICEASLKPDYDALNTIQTVIAHLGLATRSVVSGAEGDLRSYTLVTDARTMHDVVDFFRDLNPEGPQVPFMRAAYDPTFTLLGE